MAFEAWFLNRPSKAEKARQKRAQGILMPLYPPPPLAPEPLTLVPDATPPTLRDLLRVAVVVLLWVLARR
jgi:hypothetical protein